MRQYELSIRIAQVHHLIDERKYKKALTVIRTIDMRQVKGLSDLSAFAEVFTKTEQFEAAKATYLRIYKKSRTKKVLYRLIYLAIRTNSLDEAESYYQEFVRMAPNARDALILRYRIDKAKGEPIGDLIEILEALKEEEYIEEWAYELAKLYQKAGRYQECHDECDDIILWFGHGEIVDRAKKLRELLEKDKTIVFWDDTDFTDKEKAEPNPDDTGSLPDLSEYLQAKSVYERNYEDTDSEDDSKEDEDADLNTDNHVSASNEISGEDKTQFNEDGKEAGDENDEEDESEKFVDDYEDDLGDLEEYDFTRLAKESLQKLSGILKLGDKKEKFEKSFKERVASKSKENSTAIDDENEAKNNSGRFEKKKDAADELVKQVNIKPIESTSQSGTGITQDLSKEIAAIVEAEHREQLKEKAVTIIKERVNSVQEDSSVEGKADGSKAPADVEEIGVQADNVKAKEQSKPEPSYIKSPENYKEAAGIKEKSPEAPPTTRALHCSINDILDLIKAEPDPSHFVLVGSGQKRIVGIAKKIVKVMNECGYASVGKIAKINAKKLNEMKIDDVKSQLKGNCLLVDEAAELLFTTINKIFSLMDEYYGDFVVILADEGDTLDRLFKYTPSLGRRFKYIIDIHKFTEEDYREE